MAGKKGRRTKNTLILSQHLFLSHTIHFLKKDLKGKLIQLLEHSMKKMFRKDYRLKLFFQN